jgi:hypothetical protein
MVHAIVIHQLYYKTIELEISYRLFSIDVLNRPKLMQKSPCYPKKTTSFSSSIGLKEWMCQIIFRSATTSIVCNHVHAEQSSSSHYHRFQNQIEIMEQIPSMPLRFVTCSRSMDTSSVTPLCAIVLPIK